MIKLSRHETLNYFMACLLERSFGRSDVVIKLFHLPPADGFGPSPVVVEVLEVHECWCHSNCKNGEPGDEGIVVSHEVDCDPIADCEDQNGDDDYEQWC